MAFVIILSQTLLLYLCKIQCMYACECSCPDVAPPMTKVKKKKKKRRKKNEAHSRYYVEIPPTSNLLNEEKNLLFVIFSETFALVWCI